MHKRAVGLVFVILLLLFGFTLPIADAQEMQVEIISPEMNAELRGVVSIVGSASVPNFDFYKVEWGVGPNPDQWAVIGELHDQPVINEELEVWDTNGVPDGVYTLRLQAVKQDGNWEEFYVRQLTIANNQPTPTPTPTATPTSSPTPPGEGPEEEPGEGPEGEPGEEPEATATLHIIAPTDALAAPTPTPTLSRPDQGEELPVDPKSWGQALVFGGATMGAIFVLVGIAFGLRRLL